MLADHTKEVIFVGLPGPTHNYGGLSADNVASSTHRGKASNPREAALQAISLVRLLKKLGIEAGILPPQLRLNLGLLKERFTGDIDQMIREAAKVDPALLEKTSSSSAMWTANAATVAPGIDTLDGKLHLTVANLHTNLHRRIEAEDTFRVLSEIFAGVPDAVVHPPLAAADGFRDEGAANHMRLSPTHDAKGIHVFVYGTDGSAGDPASARQTLSAFRHISTAHGIPSANAVFVKQNPRVIEQGVFHNDVIAVSNESLLLVHENAYARSMGDIAFIEAGYHQLTGKKPLVIICTEDVLSVEEAVRTYFFNSQIITLQDGSMAIIAPMEVKELFGGKAASLMEHIRADAGNPVNEVHYVDLRQSMHNGGGPACLRLRVPMKQTQLAAIKDKVNVMASDAMLDKLEAIIEAHYPNHLTPQQIADPALYHNCKRVLEDIGALMKLKLV